MQPALVYSPPADRLSCQRQPARGKRRGTAGEPRHGSEGSFFASTVRRLALPVFLAAALMLGAAGRAAAAPPRPSAPGSIRVQPNEQLFATLCALYASGYPELPANISPQMRQVVTRLQSMQDPSVAALRAFYEKHKLQTPEATLSRYVSLAMVVGPPPDFHFTVPDEGVPPDVRQLQGFRPLLRVFYHREQIGKLWRTVEPYYQAQAGKLRGPVANVVTLETAYIRRMNRFEGTRTFTVNVDPLIGSITNFRIYSERYEIAVNPAVPGAMIEIRHAFLHFLLDPIVFNEEGAVDHLVYLRYYARKAPRLPDRYKYDFVSFTDECFVRAVQLRINQLSGAQLRAVLTQDDRDGYVLVRPLYNALADYEKSQEPLLRYFPKLMDSIDVQREGQREDHIAFAPAGNGPVSPKEAKADQIARMLSEGSNDIATKKEKQAIAIFENVLKIDPKNTRAMYDLGVAEALSGNGARAHQLFKQVVDSVGHGYVDPSVLAWSHVYLGRMNDLAGRRTQAVSQYQAALSVAGIPDEAREAAKAGMKRPYTPGQSHPSKTPHS